MAEVQAEVAAPAVIDQPAQTEETAPETASEDQAGAEDKPEAAETTEQQEAKKQSKFQRRLERQKTARIAAETEARILRERLAQFEGQKAPQDGEPKREQFDDYEAFVRAVARYEAKQTTKAERAQAQGNDRQAAADQATAKAWTEREAAFIKTTKDYEEVVAPFVEEELGSLSAGARRLIVDSDVGPAVLHHLATNPEVMERIADLSSVRQIAELGKLEDKLSRPAAKKTTSAPPAANHVQTGKSGQKDPSKMNQTEYRAWMKANGSRFVR